MRKVILGAVVVFLSLMIVNIASADVMVLGTVYEENFGAALANGASVSITCDGNLRNAVATSGTYAVLFNDSDCPDLSNMTISVSKAGFKTFNSEKKLVNYSEMLNFVGTRSLIIDMVLAKEGSTSNTSNNNNGGNDNPTGVKDSSICKVEVWDCTEWSACEDNLRDRRCDSNCNTFKIEEEACGLEETNSTEAELNSSIGDLPEAEEEGEGFFSTITGAVTGSMAGRGITVAVVFIVVIVAALGISKRKNKKKPVKKSSK